MARKRIAPRSRNAFFRERACKLILRSRRSNVHTGQPPAGRAARTARASTAEVNLESQILMIRRSANETPRMSGRNLVAIYCIYQSMQQNECVNLSTVPRNYKRRRLALSGGGGATFTASSSDSSVADPRSISELEESLEDDDDDDDSEEESESSLSSEVA